MMSEKEEKYKIGSAYLRILVCIVLCYVFGKMFEKSSS